MGIFLHKFETQNEFVSAYTGQEYIEPWVSYTEENEEVNYNKPTVSEQLRAYLKSLPNADHIVGVMPEFPSFYNGEGGDPTYQQYYEDYGGYMGLFLVNQCPGWDWTPLNGLTNSWLMDMIESVDWEHCYYWYWNDDHTTYPFRILYDTELPVYDPVTQSNNTFSFGIKLENEELSINDEYTIYDGDAQGVKTSSNQVFHTQRYNEY